MESDLRYYQRRAAIESAAARRALTPEARQRRIELAQAYASKVSELQAAYAR